MRQTLKDEVIQQGHDAFHAGVPRDECPHASLPDRVVIQAPKQDKVKLDTFRDLWVKHWTRGWDNALFRDEMKKTADLRTREFDGLGITHPDVTKLSFDLIKDTMPYG